MATATYFFDGNIGLTGASGWTDLTNSSNGNTANYAEGSNFSILTIEGTDAPTTGGTITQVRARIFGSNTNNFDFDTYIKTEADEFLNGGPTTLGPGDIGGLTSGAWGVYEILSAPTAGWSWDTLSKLKSTSKQGSGAPFGTREARVNRIEIEVTYSTFNPAMGHRKLLL